MFSDELEKISWEETTARINAKTEADVRRASRKNIVTWTISWLWCPRQPLPIWRRWRG